MSRTGAEPAVAADLNVCDRESIHVPGSIQPHGLVLVVSPETLTVVAGAGDIEERLAETWLGRSADELVGQDVAALLSRVDVGPGGGVAAHQVHGRSEIFDLSVHRAGPSLVLELEPAAVSPPSAASVLTWLDGAGSAFERAADLRALCDRAATAFRNLTGFDRVMIYRFLDGETGSVLAEDRDPRLSSFLNHHFPASDIPKQARALYVRNRTRVIPDVGYEPRPMRPAAAGYGGLDMSDVGLRSVSPIHIQYLKNMGVTASASISIVKDGLLWGLIACHNHTPKHLTYDVRAACRALAGGLARQIRAKEEAELYRERLRLRASEDAVTARLAGEATLDEVFGAVHDDLRRMLTADGFATIRGISVQVSGRCPPAGDVLELGNWVRDRAYAEPFSTNRLSAEFAPAGAFKETASGLLAVTLSPEEPTVLMWFRAEQIEVVRWAGDPHKAVEHEPGAVLTPRASFEAWSETVRGKALRWTLGEIQAALRLRRALFEARQNRRLRDLNRELAATISDNDGLLRQKDFLLKEVSHRIQNSLQLVSAFLGLQARAANDAVLSGHLAEAQRRISAVSLVHRRLYRDDQLETIDLARYLDDLCGDMGSSIGAEGTGQMTMDLAPILISADRAVGVGLILTELVINANKYAYGGATGPISVAIEQHRDQFRLIVADEGVGRKASSEGFGTRMIKAMVERLSGDISYGDNSPGLRAIVTAPIEDSRR